MQKRWEHGAHSGHRLHQPRGMRGIRSRHGLSTNSIELPEKTEYNCAVSSSNSLVSKIGY